MLMMNRPDPHFDFAEGNSKLAPQEDAKWQNTSAAGKVSGCFAPLINSCFLLLGHNKQKSFWPGDAQVELSFLWGSWLSQQTRYEPHNYTRSQRLGLKLTKYLDLVFVNDPWQCSQFVYVSGFFLKEKSPKKW